MICARDHIGKWENRSQASSSRDSFLFPVPTPLGGLFLPTWPHISSSSMLLNISRNRGQRGRGEGRKQSVSFLPVHSMDTVQALLSGMCSEMALSFYFFIPILPEAPREG